MDELDIKFVRYLTWKWQKIINLKSKNKQRKENLSLYKMNSFPLPASPIFI